MARLAVVMEGAPLTVMLSDWVSETPLVSVTWTVKVWLVAAAPTVPEMTPVEELIERPLGSVPAEMLQLSGVVPPVEATVWE